MGGGINGNIYGGFRTQIPELLTRSQEILPNIEGLKGRIFISAADHNPEEAMLSNINLYNELLENLEIDDLQTDFKLFKGEDHGSVPLVSLYYGPLAIKVRGV